jgi:hypothetical protein
MCTFFADMLATGLDQAQESMAGGESLCRGRLRPLQVGETLCRGRVRPLPVGEPLVQRGRLIPLQVREPLWQRTSQTSKGRRTSCSEGA